MFSGRHGVAKVTGVLSDHFFYLCLFVWLVGFLTSSSTARLYRGRAPRQSV